MEHLSEGSVAPDFELQTGSGVSKNLYRELQDRRVVLAFYKRSCPTCQLTLPFLERLFSSFGNESAAIWGVSQDDESSTREFVAEYGLEFPNLIDEYPYPVSSAYELQFVPTLYLVDTDRSVSIADYGFSKSTLRRIAGQLAADANRQVPILFSDGDGKRLPDRQPG